MKESTGSMLTKFLRLKKKKEHISSKRWTEVWRCLWNLRLHLYSFHCYDLGETVLVCMGACKVVQLVKNSLSFPLLWCHLLLWFGEVRIWGGGISQVKSQARCGGYLQGKQLGFIWWEAFSGSTSVSDSWRICVCMHTHT